MKKVNPHAPKQEKEERLHISSKVIERFKTEMQLVNNDFDKFCIAFQALKKDKGRFVAIQYTNPEKYQSFLETVNLADFDLFYDFSLPINYFKILRNRSGL